MKKSILQEYHYYKSQVSSFFPAGGINHTAAKHEKISPDYFHEAVQDNVEEYYCLNAFSYFFSWAGDTMT